MAGYRPENSEMLAVVAEFLAALEPKLDSGDRYDSIVCRHLLGIVGRELSSGAVDFADNAALAAAIRAGACDAEWDATFAKVLDRIVAQVKIVKPDHLAPEHRTSPA